MGSLERMTRPAMAAALCLSSAPLAAQAPARPELEGFGAALDRAVRRVSRAPAPAVWAGAGTRGYHLPGVGAVFVVAPRALPARPAPADRQALRAIDQALSNLEESLQGVRSVETREQIRRSLEMLRQTRAELQGTGRVVLWPPPPAGPLPPSPEADRALQAAGASQQQAAREMEAEKEGMLNDVGREIDEQVRAMNERAEMIRREADQARQEAERRIRLQLAPPAPAAPAVEGAPPAPPPPAAAVPPTAPWPPFAVAPPWHLWFEAVEGPEAGDSEAVVAAVRAALLAVLEGEGRRLSLPAEESVVVAVDFLPRGLLGAAGRPQKTLVLRARKKDIDERAQGRLAADEFRRRVQVAEY